MNQPKIISKFFVLLFGVSVAICVAMNMLNVVIPLYVTENLGGTTAICGFMSTAYTAASCVSRPLNGVLTDRIGRRRMMCLGALVFGVSCLFCGWLPTIAAAFLCRVCMGLGYSAASTANNTASTDVIPAERMSEGIGYFGISQSLASAVGPALAAFVAAAIGNTGSLYLTAVLCGMALLLALPVNYERKTDRPADQKKTTGFAFERTAILPSVLQGCSLFLVSCVMCFMTLYIVGLGYRSTVAGTFFLFSSLVIIAVRLLLSRFVGQVPNRWGLVPAFAALGGMMVLVSLADSALCFYGCAVLYGFGHGMVWMILGSEAVRRAAPERRGAANATFYFAFDAAIGLGASVWGVLIDCLDFARCFHIAAVGFAVLIVVSIIIYRKEV